jgi:hypothetical protein
MEKQARTRLFILLLCDYKIVAVQEDCSKLIQDGGHSISVNPLTSTSSQLRLISSTSVCGLTFIDHVCSAIHH